MTERRHVHTYYKHGRYCGAEWGALIGEVYSCSTRVSYHLVLQLSGSSPLMITSPARCHLLNNGVECQLAWPSSTNTSIHLHSSMPPFFTTTHPLAQESTPPQDLPTNTCSPHVSWPFFFYKAVVVWNPAFVAVIDEAQEALLRRFPQQ